MKLMMNVYLPEYFNGIKLLLNTVCQCDCLELNNADNSECVVCMDCMFFSDDLLED